MIALYRRLLSPWCLGLFVLSLCIRMEAQSSNGVLREVYLNIGGGAIADLTSNPAFPNSPSFETIQPTFEAPVDFAEAYGQRMRALFVPPQTGAYVFWLASDDNGILYLSSNEDPAKKASIATVNGWTSSREWTREPNQKSASIRLTNGFRYYLEALSKEGGGGDNLAVRVQLPSGAIEEPIPNERLLVYGLGRPVITRQPTNTTVIETGSATFAVALDHMIGASFQWLRNGLGISGETNPVFIAKNLSLADSGVRFQCAITNAYGFTNSASALLTVTPDTTPPTLSTVGNLGEKQVVFVAFSEPVSAASATNPANYSLSGGASVTRVAFGPDNRTLILTTTELNESTSYTLTVNNVTDLASTPNPIAPNTQRSFTLSIRPIDIGFQSLPKERIGPSSRRHGIVLSEVMYHPTNRVDGRNLEFIEVYNSQPWFQELGGWRISGAIDYTFPSNVVLQSRSYLVVAANPTDFRAVYSFTNVFGPFANSNALQNSSGTLRLRNPSDAVVFEMSYSGDLPFPAAADGGGHSLVLARPSYGERDPRAWTASELAGGSPGIAEPTSVSPLRTILINEILAHTDPPDVDFIELYNYGNAVVNVGQCILTDDPTTNKFVIPANTQLLPREWLVFTETELGFSLSSAGETVFLRSPDQSRVIDAVRFPAQENGVAWGRTPDGANVLGRLASSTPGKANSRDRSKQVVINEIMFDPVSSDSDDEYVELHNPKSSPLDLSGWRLRDAVSYTFPSGTTLPGGGYLVVARNAAHLRTNYPQLTLLNTLGNYNGTLANGGERIELTKPDEVAGTNAAGVLVTNKIHIPVDEVSFGTGGRWGRWAAGGGSSLELRDPNANNRLAPNWAESDESAKSDWVTVETTGVMDNGWADAYQLHITLYGAGEALIDNIEVIPAGGGNVLANGTFESGTEGWVFQGNHNQSSWEPTAGFSSSRSLHVRASGRGDSGSNRIRTQLPNTLAPGTTVTLRAKARWLKGNPNLLLRLRGNWLEAPGFLLTARNLGTPGAPNSQRVSNAGPAITDVQHYPALPSGNQAVLITARVNDPDGLAYLAVQYRVDPTNTYRTVAMTNNGGGLYSTAIPGQAAGTGVAFYVQATDNALLPTQATFPADAPNREAVIRWGDNSNPGTLPTYRMWISQTNVARWSSEERMSNRAKDLTFIYGTNRVIYNAGGWYHGSPYHSPGYDSPLGVSCDYDLGFPEDDKLLGETDVNLFRPGNGGGDGTAQAEIHGYWFGEQFGIPFLYHRPVFVFVNGQRRETVFHDAQQPNGDFADQWYPDDSNGDLHKIQLGFEFGDQAYGASEPGYSVVGANLAFYTTTGGAFKQARYRATLPLRSASPTQQNDYTNLFNLIRTSWTSAPLNSDAYTAALANLVDVEEWFKVHVSQHLYNNGDSFSYGGGQNAFMYKPERDTWKLFLWDIDFAFGGDPNDANLFGIGGADHGPRNDHAPFARIYWQALIEAANGFLTAARSNPILDARFSGLTAAGAAVGSPQGIKDFIVTRRNRVLSSIAASQSPFAITSNGGTDFTTNRNLIALSGTAPLEVRTLLINGIPYPVSWTSVSNWTIRLPLTSGQNTLVITGVDPKGQAVVGVNRTIRVTYTGVDELPENRVVINEIMYHPAVGDAGFIELFNSSTANVFDLSNWRVEGADFTFPPGTLIEPGSYLVVAKDRNVFASVYGSTIPVVGEFAGQLENGGETLTLIRPGPTPDQDRVIARVTYDDDPPFPAAADGLGASLQLVDATQDLNRAANWQAAEVNTTTPPQSLIRMTNLWRYNETADLTGVNWTAPGYNDTSWPTGPALLFVEGAALPAPKSTPLTLGRTTYYFRTHFTHLGSPAGAALSLQTVIDDGVMLYLNGKPLYPLGVDPANLSYGTFSTRGVGDAILEGPFLIPGNDLLPGDNVLAAEVHQSGASSSDIVFGLTLDTTYTLTSLYTPGAANSVRDVRPAFPTLWLNEVMPTNFFLGANGITDRFGERDPWVELYNGGSQDLSLNGYYLANNYTNLGQWAFPAGTVIRSKGFLLVWLDGQTNQSAPNELHANFRAAASIGSVALGRGTNQAALVDHLNYRVPVAGRTYGSYPDGLVSHRRTFTQPSPAATNNPASAPVTVYINEWMADNASSLSDPLDGKFEDWIELYNPGDHTVELAGFYLSDTVTNATQWEFPEGAAIPSRGYLLVWADNSPGQNNPPQPDLHANFSLGKSGESIALFAPDGTLIDAVSFGLQTTDVSQGHMPDGTGPIGFMTNGTPRAANGVPSANQNPILEPIANRTIPEGSLLSIQCVASDPDGASPSLRFFLEPGAPGNATLHGTNGLFRWIPTEQQGPGVYGITIRVTDGGQPALSALQTFQVTVSEVNNPPVLSPFNSQTVNEGSLLSMKATAVDPETGSTGLTFALDPGYPAGMTIHPQSGIINWTPTEAQGPGTYPVTVRVTDDGDPNLSATEALTVFVVEVNTPPTLTTPDFLSGYAGSLFSFQASGADSDQPGQGLIYSLGTAAPTGTALDPITGLFSWTATEAALGTNFVELVLTDTGSPRLSQTKTVRILVLRRLSLSIEISGAEVVLHFETLAGRSYRAEYKDTLMDEVWRPLGEPQTATATQLSIRDTQTSGTQRFYRVILVE